MRRDGFQSHHKPEKRGRQPNWGPVKGGTTVSPGLGSAIDPPPPPRKSFLSSAFCCHLPAELGENPHDGKKGPPEDGAGEGSLS